MLIFRFFDLTVLLCHVAETYDVIVQHAHSGVIYAYTVVSLVDLKNWGLKWRKVFAGGGHIIRNLQYLCWLHQSHVTHFVQGCAQFTNR